MRKNPAAAKAGLTGWSTKHAGLLLGEKPRWCRWEQVWLTGNGPTRILISGEKIIMPALSTTD